jgi:CBS domain containing-hemolysin-like protein
VSLWILEKVQRIPKSGETFEFDGLTVTVKRATQRRILELDVSR